MEKPTEIRRSRERGRPQRSKHERSIMKDSGSKTHVLFRNSGKHRKITTDFWETEEKVSCPKQGACAVLATLPPVPWQLAQVVHAACPWRTALHTLLRKNTQHSQRARAGRKFNWTLLLQENEAAAIHEKCLGQICLSSASAWQCTSSFISVWT